MHVPVFTEEITWQENKYTLEVYKSHNFSYLTDIRQSYGLILNEQDKILIVGESDTHWTLPGGAIEANENSVEALRRESIEEAAVVVQKLSITPFFYQNVYTQSREFSGSQVRYIARVEKINQFTNDPGGNIIYQQWVDVADLGTYLNWGTTITFIQENFEKAITLMQTSK